MTPGGAKEAVLLTMVGTFAIQTVSTIGSGQTPRPRQLIGTGFAFVLLAALATPAPELAAMTGGLILVSTALGRGVSAFGAVARATGRDTPITPPGPANPNVQGPPAPANVGGTGPNTTGGQSFTPGGIGGNWAGSAIIAESIARTSGLPVTSRKRDTKLTASGGISDHWTGKLNAYAVDLQARGPVGDRVAHKIAAAFGVPDYFGGSWLNIPWHGYRIQIGWKVPGHNDHIHVGVEKT